ncbi:hypothetical protein ACLMJK_004329 [Lecanora helva]
MKSTTLTTLFSLSAGALTLPTNTTITPPNPSLQNTTLHSRGESYGWLSSFAPADIKCTGDHTQYRPKVKKGCIPFVPASDNVGINWGHLALSFSGMDFYSDGNCKNKLGHVKPGDDMAQKGADLCVHLVEKGWSGKVGSVRGTGTDMD